MFRPLIGAFLASTTLALAAAPPDAAALTRFARIEAARRAHYRGLRLFAAGKVGEASEPLVTTYLEREALYPKATHPKGHYDLALSVESVASLMRVAGRAADAMAYQLRARAMLEAVLGGRDDHALASCLNNLAALHQQAEKYAEAVALFEQAARMRERLVGDGDDADLALNLGNLGVAYTLLAEWAKAEPPLKRSLAMVERLHPGRAHPDAVAALNALGGLYRSSGEAAKAAPLFRRALEMSEKLSPRSDSPDVAASASNLATALSSMGEPAKAEPLFRRALAAYERRSGGKDDADVAAVLGNLGVTWDTLGDPDKAEPFHRRAVKMREALHPKGHPELARALNNLGHLLFTRGDYAGAEPLLARALKMREAVYRGAAHPAVADSLGNLAALYVSQGEPARAEPLLARALRIHESRHGAKPHADVARSLNSLAVMYEARGDTAEAVAVSRRALKMRESLHGGRDHADVARSLNNLAVLLDLRGEYDEARRHYERALAMRKRLAGGRDHSEVAVSLNNLAALRRATGDVAEAEKGYLAALAMNERLYPGRDHPDTAMGLSNLGFLRLFRGEADKAARDFRRAMRMYDGLAAAVADGTSEATAANLVGEQPACRDGLLAATVGRADVYDAIWSSKANLTRAAERAHLAALAAATSGEAKKILDEIRGMRRERERLLLAEADADGGADRAGRLDAIDAELRTATAKLRPLLPAVSRFEASARAGPADLRRALPPGSAFVDVIRYYRFAFDPKARGEKAVTRAPHYAAFVVTRDGVARAELGPAAAIDAAVARWRECFEIGKPGDEFEPKCAADVRRLVWAPLVGHLPAATEAVYVSPDAAMSRVPWAALRDPAGRVLIEAHAVAVVPHGPFLLDRLAAPRPKSGRSQTLLAFGAVDYSGAARGASATRSPAVTGRQGLWAPLPGTAAELEGVTAMAKGRTIVARKGTAADGAALLADLPAAEVAHVATHGFFADAAFRSWLNLDPKLFERRGFERAGHGARNPLVLSGLVCAGANRKETPGRGIVTAEAVVGLDLRRLRLAVLSACETGLGEVADGEGVHGLTRAFHVAGTRNVVASLWKVPDEPTAALMNHFYANLWAGDKSLSPLEALRRAQLAVYRRPESVKEWAAERGTGGTLGKVVERPKPGTKTSPARAWAAFVLSGPGD